MARDRSTYRNPSARSLRMLLCSSSVTGWYPRSRRNSNAPAASKAVSSENAAVRPAKPATSPPSAGPTKSEAARNPTFPMITAFCSWGRVTIRGSTPCRAGFSKAPTAPITAERRNTGHRIVTDAAASTT